MKLKSSRYNPKITSRTQNLTAMRDIHLLWNYFRAEIIRNCSVHTGISAKDLISYVVTRDDNILSDVEKVLGSLMPSQCSRTV